MCAASQSIITGLHRLPEHGCAGSSIFFRDADSSDFTMLQLMLPAIKYRAHAVVKRMQLTWSDSRAAAASVVDSVQNNAQWQVWCQGLTCARAYELNSPHAPVQLFFRQWPHSRHRDADLLQEATRLRQMKSTCTKCQSLNNQSKCCMNCAHVVISA